MRFFATEVEGVRVIEADPTADARGFFARLYCPEEFNNAGVHFTPKQVSISHNEGRLTLRGMHYSTEPEAKLVHCTRGRIFDVALDLRLGSPTFSRWCGYELSPENGRALYIEAGVAHGFLTLEEKSDVLYHTDRVYRSGFDAGVRWDDPQFSIRWPEKPAIILARDGAYTDFHPGVARCIPVEDEGQPK